MNFNIVACIPARYKSLRLPGKPLLKINDKTIINHVYDRVNQSTLIDMIYVLTDDERIEQEVLRFGGNCIMKNIECLNGTERICKSLEFIDNKYTIIVNIQGDEPFIDPLNIDKCISNFIQNNYNNFVCATLHTKITHEEAEKTSIGKLVLDCHNNIMYCSRVPIPSTKLGKINKNINYYGHIGLFVFNRHYLENHYMEKNYHCQLSEDIEWLKIIESGNKINSTQVDFSEISVDTREDYNYLVAKYSA